MQAPQIEENKQTNVQREARKEQILVQRTVVEDERIEGSEADLGHAKHDEDDLGVGLEGNKMILEENEPKFEIEGSQLQKISKWIFEGFRELIGI